MLTKSFLSCKKPRICEAFSLQEYPGRELNPYRYYYPQDFKSCVSTNSTTRAFLLGDLIISLFVDFIDYPGLWRICGRPT